MVDLTPWHKTVGIAQIVKDSGLTRQVVYRVKDDWAGNCSKSSAFWGTPAVKRT